MAQVHPENEHPRKEVEFTKPPTFSVVWVVRVQSMDCSDVKGIAIHAVVKFIRHN